MACRVGFVWGEADGEVRFHPDVKACAPNDRPRDLLTCSNCVADLPRPVRARRV